MTRIEGIIQQLATHPTGCAGEIQLSAGDLTVRLHLADWDRLGCLLESLDVQSAQGAPLVFDPIRITERVTYLGETLEVIEVISGAGWALLRSAPPCTRDGTVSFFEMILDRQHGLSLTRYAVDRERGERTRVSAPLTRHALERLLADLLELASEP
jgi:hypothetical protein